MAGAADMFYRASGERNRAAFVLFKAFSIAQTGIATYEAAVQAYKAMAGIPIIGPGLAVAAAAAAVAFGLGNIVRIAAIQPGSSAGGAVGGGAPSPLQIPVPSAVTNNNNSRSLNITLYINGVLSNDTDFNNLVRDQIIPGINKAISDGLSLDV